MELNREQVIKALEKLGTDEPNPCPYCPSCPALNYALRVVEELAEEKAIQVITAIELDKQVERLTEENERLTSLCTSKDVIIADLNEENVIYANGVEKVAVNYYNQAKADTVRKMHSEIEARCIKGGIYPAFVKRTIDQIAKEILEEG